MMKTSCFATVVVLLAGLLGGSGCAALGSFARNTTWEAQEGSCSNDIAACKQRCSQGVDEACDVLLVYQVEDNPAYMAFDPSYHGLAEQDLGALRYLDQELTRLCEDGIERACKAKGGVDARLGDAQGADEALQALAEQVKKIEATAAEAESLMREAKLSDLEAHAVTMKLGSARQRANGALAAAKTGGQIPSSNARLKAAAAEPAKPESVREELEAAQGLAEDAVALVKDLIEKRAARRKQAEAAAKAKAEEEEKLRAEKKAFDEARSRCKTDLGDCERRCKADSGSNDCLALALHLFFGADVPKDRKRARTLVDAACAGGLQGACNAVAVFDKHEDEEKQKAQAERDLPGLFAKCERNRAKVAQLKRARDYDGLKEIEREWAATLDQLREAISLVTDDEGPRYQQLILQVRSRCSL